MAATFHLKNFGYQNLREKTYLSADAAAGVGTFVVENNQGLSAGSILIFGTLGDEQSDKLAIQSVSGATGVTTTANSSQKHLAGDPVQALYGDKVQLYRVAVPTDGSLPAPASFSAVGSPVAIDFDQFDTEVTDATGSANYWYGFTYYSTATATETALADSEFARGAGYGHYVTIIDVRKASGFENNRNISDEDLNGYRQTAEDEVNGELNGMFTLPFTFVPRTIQNVTKLLASGYALLDEYGPFATGTNRDGNARLKQARDILDRIKNRGLTLNDATYTDMATSVSIGFWPDDSTADLTESDHGGGNIISIDHKF